MANGTSSLQSESTSPASVMTIMRTQRRTQAIFEAFASDKLLREQFVTDPASILSEYVLGERLDPEAAETANGFLYSVLSNPDLRRWMINYAQRMRSTAPDRHEFAVEFAKAAAHSHDPLITLALMRAGASPKARFSLHIDLLRSLVFSLQPGGVFAGTEMSPGGGTEMSPGGTEMSPGALTGGPGGVFAGTEMSPGGTEMSPGALTGGPGSVFAGTEMSPGGGTEMSPGGTEMSPGALTGGPGSVFAGTEMSPGGTEMSPGALTGGPGSVFAGTEMSPGGTEMSPGALTGGPGSVFAGTEMSPGGTEMSPGALTGGPGSVFAGTEMSPGGTEMSPGANFRQGNLAGHLIVTLDAIAIHATKLRSSNALGFSGLEGR